MYRLFFFSLLVIVFACKEAPKKTAPSLPDYKKLSGITMGVIPYNITYKNEVDYNLKPAIDSLLENLNMGSSTYEAMATISVFNKSKTGIRIEDKSSAGHFLKNVLISKEVYEKTDGYFDPTVGPLMKYYGFRKKELESLAAIDTAKVQALHKLVGFDKISIQKDKEQYHIGKSVEDIQLDFSAIAKGYAIDEVGRFLESKSINDYLIEIGGELRGKGKNAKGNWWKIAIKKPVAEAAKGRFMDIPFLKNKSMATSGNYENFRIIDGKKMGHTMNPKTGFPELNPLLSATVFADECIIADSYATAFMAMGLDKALNLAEKLPEIEAYFIYFDENGKISTNFTSGFKENFKNK